MQKNSIIYVAGGQTMVGAALIRLLIGQGFTNLVGLPGDGPDPSNRTAVDNFFSSAQPEYVFLAAGKSGGIEANRKFPAELMLDNLLIECNIIDSAYQHGTQKLLYLASSCSYPKLCPQPMQVESLLTGPLEPSNEAYAVAKIAGIKLCQSYRQQYGANFIVGIPANPFGPGDNFNSEDSHVIAALIRKTFLAMQKGEESIEVWGTGSPRREFIYVDDLANACLFVMQHYQDVSPINLGGGTDLSIADLARSICGVIGYPGALHFNLSKPDGMPLKALDSSKLLALGWRPITPFREALVATFNAFLLSI